MGGKNKERQQNQQTYNQTLSYAKEESPYERMRRERAERIKTFAESGDYRNPTGELRLAFNFADPAERKRQSEILANTRGQGVSALGAGANPTLLALDKQHRDDVAERDTATNYQETLSRMVAGAYDDLGSLQGMDQAKRLGILGTTAGVYSSTPQKKPWWETLMGTVGQVGAGAASNPAMMAAL